MRLIQFRPPRIAMVLLFLAAIVHFALPTPLHYELSNVVAALILGGFGFAIMMWAWWLFQRHQTAICPTAHTRILITTGVYRFSRNPMYLGMMLMMLSVSILAGTAPFFVASAIYFLILNPVFCPYEEQKLIKAFGDQYTAYMKKVRRWL